MGALFSSESDPLPAERRPYSFHSDLMYEYDSINDRIDSMRCLSRTAPQHYETPSPQVPRAQPTWAQPPRPQPPRMQPRAQVSNLPLAPAVREKTASASSWESNPLPRGDTYRLVDLPDWHEDHERARREFKRTNRRCQVVRVQRVENPYLLGRYLLKKEEMSQRYGSVREVMVFHGTKAANVIPICENNFDWRLHGGNLGHRFGQGVSFSPSANYATHYCDKKSQVKVMFYAQVLVWQSIVGEGSMVLPPTIHAGTNVRFDSSAKANNQVLVKFSDDEFYPKYIIYYSQKA